MLFVPDLVLSRTAKLHKLCIVRATSPKEEATSNTPLTDVQEAPQKRRKKVIVEGLWDATMNRYLPLLPLA